MTPEGDLGSQQAPPAAPPSLSPLLYLSWIRKECKGLLDGLESFGVAALVGMIASGLVAVRTADLWRDEEE